MEKEATHTNDLEKKHKITTTPNEIRASKNYEEETKMANEKKNSNEYETNVNDNFFFIYLFPFISMPFFLFFV